MHKSLEARVFEALQGFTCFWSALSHESQLSNSVLSRDSHAFGTCIIEHVWSNLLSRPTQLSTRRGEHETLFFLFSQVFSYEKRAFDDEERPFSNDGTGL
ncbi:hypothetical protein O6H91_17G022000 [Diphasiastrum complanatum]|uniref:Uncharacterized protein n=1 Tax=Diphasiastrum complanatum TaxID=34168 RepID=A0ACC2B4T7_DIPCM|nr:hypothetical protein O6H91_17G022000 [Diphasiastrum complanatum]